MIWFADDSKTYNVQAELRADSSSDVADLPTFATEHALREGSSCLIIGSGDFYMMDSTAVWREI